LPLQIGNTWRYGAHDLTTGLDTRFGANVTNAASISGALGFTLLNLRGECEYLVGGSQADGWYLYDMGNGPLVPPWRQFTYPVHEGQQSTRDGMTLTNRSAARLCGAVYRHVQQLPAVQTGAEPVNWVVRTGVARSGRRYGHGSNLPGKRDSAHPATGRLPPAAGRVGLRRQAQARWSGYLH